VPKNYLILVAAGSGSRFKSELPKQFIQINGREIFLYAIEKFLQYDPHIKIIVVVSTAYKELMTTLLKANAIYNVDIVVGGQTRFHSVQNGLSEVKEQDAIVAIHDAARPLVSVQTIQNCMQKAQKNGNAIPVVVINESMREVGQNKNYRVDRNLFRIVQTPQCFLANKIKSAYEVPFNDNFTDDASVLEANGEKINLVEGNFENIKITNPQDLVIAKALIEHEQR
jgi:2-C-methyl-D-erythritol 4-phosphate cytidylyltransferase